MHQTREDILAIIFYPLLGYLLATLEVQKHCPLLPVGSKIVQDMTFRTGQEHAFL